jgi:hypothetical protein
MEVIQMGSFKNVALHLVEIDASYLPFVSTEVSPMEMVEKMRSAAVAGFGLLAGRGFQAFRTLTPHVMASYGKSGFTVAGASIGAYGEVDADAFGEAHPELARMGLRISEIIISPGDGSSGDQPSAFVSFAGDAGEFGWEAIKEALAGDYQAMIRSLAAIVADSSTAD